MRCLRSVLSIAEAQSTPAANLKKVLCVAAHAHWTPCPLAALRAAQVPLHSPDDTAVTIGTMGSSWKSNCRLELGLHLPAVLGFFALGTHNLSSFQFTERALIRDYIIVASFIVH